MECICLMPGRVALIPPSFTRIPGSLAFCSRRCYGSRAPRGAAFRYRGVLIYLYRLPNLEAIGRDKSDMDG